jgi:hypothetical protein
MSLTISSPAFPPMGAIPARYTCDGENISPPLVWSGAPRGTRSFALIVEDPDAPDPAAPKRTYVHWVLYDIPATTASLPEGATAADLPPGTREGTNDWRRTGYGGPCPPIGRHRYFFRLFALDAALGDRGALTRGDLLRAMEGHVLESAELVGTYAHPAKAR